MLLNKSRLLASALATATASVAVLYQGGLLNQRRGEEGIPMTAAAAHQGGPTPSKLYYFDTAGRGFMIRAMLRYGNIPFDDVRLDQAGLSELRGGNNSVTAFNDKVPLGQLPVLSFSNGETVCQSFALARYVAKLTGLYPNDPWKALIVDEVVDSVAEISTKAITLRYATTKSEEERKKLVDDLKSNLPRYMELVNRHVKKSGGPYVLGKDMSLADFTVLRFLEPYLTGRDNALSRADFEAWPALIKLYEQGAAHPLVEEENKRENARAAAKAAAAKAH